MSENKYIKPYNDEFYKDLEARFKGINEPDLPPIHDFEPCDVQPFQPVKGKIQIQNNENSKEDNNDDQEITSIEEGLEKMKKVADESLYRSMMKFGIRDLNVIDNIYIIREVLFDEDICNEQ